MITDINMITNEYIKEIENTFKSIEYITTKINKGNHELQDQLYIYCILGMCIRFESYCTEVYAYQNPGVKMQYNQPFFQLRKISDDLRIDIKKNYQIVHDLWDVYNALKHVNQTTKNLQVKAMKKYNINTLRDLANMLKNQLISLMKLLLV